MAEFDDLVPNYRRASERWPTAANLSEHFEAVVDCYGNNGHSLIETVKSFIECVCITILGEYGKTVSTSTPSTTDFLVEALKALGLENTRGTSVFDKVLSAHNRLADALTEVRNTSGTVAHGKDGFIDTLSRNHLRAVLIAGDSILALLMAALDGTEPDVQYTREPYERFQHLHGKIDASVIVDATVDDDADRSVFVVTFRTENLPDGFDLRIEPSKLLYYIDRTAYVELLSTSPLQVTVSGGNSEKINTEEETSVEIVTDEPATKAEESEPHATIPNTYQGRLSPLREEFEQYLLSLNLSLSGDAQTGARLSDSLLATADQNMGIDWTSRENLQAKMRVSLRRTLVQFAIDLDVADQVANHLVEWFKIKVAGGGVLQLPSSFDFAQEKAQGDAPFTEAAT